jgi:transposase
VLPPDVWVATPVAAQALIVALAEGVAALAPLRAEVAALREEVRDLRARLGQHSSNSSRPPSSDPPGAPRRPPTPPSGRRAGGQPGHTAQQRTLAPPERVDAVVTHRPVACARCATPLPADVAPTGYVAHQVTELPVVRAVVTEHRLHRVVCPACGELTRAALPPGVARGAFGPRLQGTVALLRGGYRLSERQIVDLCGMVLDAPLCVGSVDALCRDTAAALEEPVAAVRATLPAAPVVNADETHWPHPQARRRHWLWVAVTEAATVFTLAASRGSAVIKALLGEDDAGVVGSDRYGAYGWLDESCRQPGTRLRVWAHLVRDLQALVDRGGAAERVGAAALAVVDDLFAAWHRFRGGALDRAGLLAALAPVQDALAAVVDDGLACGDPKAVTLCAALDRRWPQCRGTVDLRRRRGSRAHRGPSGRSRPSGRSAGRCCGARAPTAPSPTPATASSSASSPSSPPAASRAAPPSTPSPPPAPPRSRAFPRPHCCPLTRPTPNPAHTVPSRVSRYLGGCRQPVDTTPLRPLAPEHPFPP